MKKSMNLWQRCEALGPMEDQGVELYKNEVGDYRFYIDSMPVFQVHQDGTINDICRAWLAEAILQRFEAITKQGGTVLTTDNVVKEVERMYNQIPQPTEPTYEQRKRLYELLYASNGMGNTEFEVSVDSIPKVFLRRKSDGRSMCAISPAKYDYAFINGGISFETACATVGMNAKQCEPDFLVGDTVEVIADDPMDIQAKIPVANRWKIGEQLVVSEIEVLPWGTFLRTVEGYSLNHKRAKLVSRPTELPTPKNLPEPTYIVESPKEFVSIPVGEYFDARASIEQVKEAFGKLSEAFAAISKMYTPEP